MPGRLYMLYCYKLSENENRFERFAHFTDFIWFLTHGDRYNFHFSGVNCNTCQKLFQNINQFFHHKKSEHKKIMKIKM